MSIFFVAALCKYKEIIVKSTYELRTCEILDRLKMNGIINKWEYEPEKIYYISDKYNKNTKDYSHFYTPDFKVYIKDFFFYIESKGRMTDTVKFLLSMMKNKGYHIELWKKSQIEEFEKFLGISKEEVKYIEDICRLLEYLTE